MSSITMISAKLLVLLINGNTNTGKNNTIIEILWTVTNSNIWSLLQKLLVSLDTVNVIYRHTKLYHESV